MEPAKRAAKGPHDEVLWFLHEVRRLTSADDILDAAMRELTRYGFETLLVSYPRDPNKRNEELVLGRRSPPKLIDTLLAWDREYSDKHYADRDPVVRRMQSDWRPFHWHDVQCDSDRDPDAVEIMERRKGLGIEDALVVPIFGLFGFSGFVLMSGPKVPLCGRSKPALHLLSTYLFHQMQAFQPCRSKKSALTPREREVLTWVAHGKTAWDIGEILNIAKRTVDEHVQSACKKLDAANRTQAVAIAIRDRAIQF